MTKVDEVMTEEGVKKYRYREHWVAVEENDLEIGKTSQGVAKEEAEVG